MHLHHIGVENVDEFRGVRFVFVCGTEERAFRIASVLCEKPREIGRSRFVVYKCNDDMIVCSHGMGAPSISICMNELLKAVQGPVHFIRVGTCGGIGVPEGTVVCTTEALNEDLEPYYEVNIMGKKVRYPTVMELIDAEGVCYGKTLSANCFYENQGRMDGAFCSFSKQDQEEFLMNLYEKGVRTIEMEIVAFSAMVHRAGHRASAICVVLVDRLKSEHISISTSEAEQVLLDVICKSQTCLRSS